MFWVLCSGKLHVLIYLIFILLYSLLYLLVGCNYKLETFRFFSTFCLFHRIFNFLWFFSDGYFSCLHFSATFVLLVFPFNDMSFVSLIMSWKFDFLFVSVRLFFGSFSFQLYLWLRIRVSVLVHRYVFHLVCPFNY